MKVRYTHALRRMRLNHRSFDYHAFDYTSPPIRREFGGKRIKQDDLTETDIRMRKIGNRFKKHHRIEKKRRFKDGRERYKPNPKTIPVSELDLSRSMCMESFYEFLIEFWSEIVAEKYIDNWHIKLLCDELQVMAERVFRGEKKIYDLVVNIAPGTTKSLIFSVMFPAWAWTRMPSFRFIGASYAYDLQEDLSVKCRDLIRGDKYREYFPQVRIDEQQDTKKYFKTTAGGFRFGVGVDGGVTGRHAHFIVIDDPLNPQEALSPAEMKAANHWIKNTLSNRKVDKAVTPTALVMQRLHQDDPTANFLRQKRIRHICLPAQIEPGVTVIEPEELEEFYVDGLMDPTRLGLDVLAEEKLKGEFYYSSQFRQDPVPAGGGMFKVKRIKHELPPDKFVRMVRFWDKAGTAGGGAYTAGVLIGLDKQGRFWVLDCIRVQLDSADREALILRTAKQDGSHVIVGLEQEPGSGGKESMEATKRNLKHFRVQEIKVGAQTGGKENRADPMSVQVNSGNFFIPEHLWDGDAGSWCGWAEAYIEELKYFPHSRYMDQVDASSGAFNMTAVKRIRIGAIDPSEGYVSLQTGKKPYSDVSGLSSRRERLSRHMNRKLRHEALGLAS